MNNKNSRIGVHVIGFGFGESIIIEMPNGEFGLIDCFSPKLTYDDRDPSGRIRINPILRFLKEELKAPKLAFLAFTHPHEDHGRGLSHILEEYKDKIDEIWIFNGYDLFELEKYFEARLARKIPSEIEELLFETPGFFSAEFLKIYLLVRKQCDLKNPKRARERLFTSHKQFKIGGAVVHFIAADDNISSQYKESLLANMGDLLYEPGAVINQGWNPLGINHNLVSGGLLFQFGDTRLIFGGDMEQGSWEQVLNDSLSTRETMPKLKCHYLKVSHHGSNNGNCNGLYDKISNSVSTLGVVTPYNRSNSPLPAKDCIDNLVPILKELFTTNLSAAKHSLGEECPLPEKWATMIIEDPSLIGTLNDSVSQADADVKDYPFIPVEWLEDIYQNPLLLYTLRKHLRLQARELIENRCGGIAKACRISIFFNSQGEEIVKSRYIGPLAGSLSKS